MTPRIGIPGRLGLILAFKVSLDIATVFISAEALGIYSIDVEFDWVRTVVGYIAAAALAIALPGDSRRIDQIILWLMVLFVGIPMLIPYQWAGGSFAWMLTNTLFWVGLGAQSRVRLMNISPLSVAGGWWPLGAFFGAVAAYSILTAVLVAGLTVTFDFSIVYSIRDRFVAQQIPFDSYLYKWTAFIVAPLLLVLGIRKKRPVFIVAAVGIAVVLFFATGHKAYILILPFIYIIDWSVRRTYPCIWLVLGLTTLVLAGTVTFYSFGDKRLNATFSNRMYVLPAKISYEYHEYFSEHRKVMLSHSVLGRFLDYPYAQSPQSLISSRYYGNPEGYPNTGILGDAFMNFGYIGVAILWFFVAVILRVFRWLAKGKDPRIVLALLIFPVFTWVNSGFLTSFLTAGLAFAMFGALLLPVRAPQQVLAYWPPDKAVDTSAS